MNTKAREESLEMTDKIFIIKKTDDEGQTFETKVSNNSYLYMIYMYIYLFVSGRRQAQ